MKKTKKETYFWLQLIKLCNQRNLHPYNVTQAIGMNNAAATDWKNGAVPRDTNLKKIADYFGVPVEYFKEDSSPTVVSSVSGKLIVGNPLTSHEHSVIMAYRAHPEIQFAIDKLLGISNYGEIDVYTAANSDSGVYDKHTSLNKEEFKAMKNEPRGEDVN